MENTLVNISTPDHGSFCMSSDGILSEKEEVSEKDCFRIFLERATKGRTVDKMTFSIVYSATKRYFFHYIYCDRHDLYEDIIHEAITAFWRNRSGFAGKTREEFYAYIRRSINTFLDSSYFKKRNHLPLSGCSDSDDVILPSPDRSIESSVICKNEIKALYESIEQLPVPDKELITMHLEGSTNRDISQLLRVDESTISKRLTNARSRLRTSLEMKGFDRPSED